MRPSWVLTALSLIMILSIGSQDAFAQRGRGGGGGGGGIRGGGGAGGAGGAMHSSIGGGVSRPTNSRPAQNTIQRAPMSTGNHSPSMSRVSPQTAGSRAPARNDVPAANSRLNSAQTNRNPNNFNKWGTANSGGFGNQQAFSRPSNEQLNNFLSGSQSSSRGAARSNTSSFSSNSQASNRSGDGSNTKSFTTEGGSTITVGGKAGSGTTEGGANFGGAVGGVKIETAGGDTIVRGKGAVGGTNGDSAAFAAGSRTGVKTAEGGAAVGGSGIRGATDGENAAVQGGRFAAGVDSEGNAALAARGGYADSSGYRQGGSVTARHEDGFTRVNVSGGYNNNGTGQIKTGTAIVGPNGNVVSAGRGATFVNGQFVGGSAWTAVNGNYTHWGYFGPGYVTTYPNCWWPGKWAVAATAWSTVAWAVAGPYCGCASTSTYYDYGQNVTYADGNVYYGDEPVATEEQYYEEASSLADNGSASQNEDWLPLGVFAIIGEADQENTDKVAQLAVNRDGVIRGNYHDLLADKVTPIYGSVDKDSQRVVLKLEGNANLMVETGLYNLTNDECPVLVHFDSGHRADRTFVRLHQPDQK